MPLFASISGYLYASRPVLRNQKQKFVLSKIRRLLLPAFSLLTIYLLLNIISIHFAGGYNFQIRINSFDIYSVTNFYLYRPLTYWFLQSLFIIFLIVSLIFRIKKFEYLLSAIFGLSIVCCLLLSNSTVLITMNWLSLNGVLYLFPFFVLGFTINMHFDTIYQRKTLIGIFVLFCCFFILHILSFESSTLSRIEKYSSPVSIGLGIFGLLLLYRFRFVVSGFSIFGFYSFSIYLYHRFCFDFLNIVFRLMDWGKPNILLVICFSLITPIILYRLFIINKTTRLVFLGEKY